MKGNERGAAWFVVCLIFVAAALGLAQSRGVVLSSDWQAAQLAPWSAYAQGLKAGSLSLWSPLQFGGYPLLATGSVAALYPPNVLLHTLLPMNIALSALVLLHLLWATAGAWLLARALGARGPLSAAAAVAFALVGLLLSPIVELNGWMAAAWLPWLLWLTDRLCSPTASRSRAASLLALALGMSFLAGGSAGWVGLLLAVAYALYLVSVRKPGRAVLAWLASALGLGVVLYLPQFLPAREWAAWSVPGTTAAGQPAPLTSWRVWLPAGVLLAAVLVARGLELFLSRVRNRLSSVVVALLLIAALLATYLVRLPAQASVDTARPRSADFLLPQTGIYRLYTQARPGAVPSALRESLSGGLGAAYGLPTVDAAAGVGSPRLYQTFASQLTPNTLNLLGVKYYLIPQPRGEGGQAYDLDDPFIYNPMDKVAPTPIVMCSLVEIEWYLSDSAGLSNGEPVAVLTVVPEEMDEAQDFNLTVGSHVADWAYDRSDVRATVKHNQASVARTFPARSENPPEEFTGYVYKATIRLAYPTLTQGLWFTSRYDPARMHIERVVMTDTTGARYVLSELEGKSDHVLVYRSEDVAIFENYDLLPRAFLAYAARSVPNDEEALALLRSIEFNPRQEVLLAGPEVKPVTPPTEGSESISIRSYAPEKVTLDVTAPAAAYLVLTDAWYPGWAVKVDGQPAALERADGMFRAVYLEPGQHVVDFVYAPASFRSGLIAAAAALLAALAMILSPGFGSKRAAAR